MELEFHKKRHYRPPWNAAIGKKKKKNMELKFKELEFHKKCHYKDLKCHYRAPYGAIKLKKLVYFKRPQ